MTGSFITPEVFAFVIVPVLIFLARVCDMSLDTIRVIFVSKGIRYLPAIVGFFEVIIWLVAIGQVMNNLTNVVCYLAYGAGFATGTIIGMAIEERLSLGLATVRIITAEDPAGLIRVLRSHDYGVTVLDAEGGKGRVKVIFTIIKRQDLQHVVSIIKDFNPDAFYSVEDVKAVAEGVFPSHNSHALLRWADLLNLRPKGK
ncbi:DUF2179 domain-containing protein [Methanoregula formicica]|uniref:UPF0316 protein Metfor_0763 n=1 Tax=Methanoregula formicica (strain DSM 22288 / NBRC 105244 / SMSP) TaxID=593750 RepID=L0HET3_METFS|nr:DUF2179 domain-containing protein [Methanoregula formicica]AGB01823.1 hypothetical protein Metfor_0763 [Methanoregula formicica SMSP]